MKNGTIGKAMGGARNGPGEDEGLECWRKAEGRTQETETKTIGDGTGGRKPRRRSSNALIVS